MNLLELKHLIRTYTTRDILWVTRLCTFSMLVSGMLFFITIFDWFGSRNVIASFMLPFDFLGSVLLIYILSFFWWGYTKWYRLFTPLPDAVIQSILITYRFNFAQNKCWLQARQKDGLCLMTLWELVESEEKQLS